MIVIAPQSLVCFVLSEVLKLEIIKRTGWLLRGVEEIDVENDLTHTLRLHRLVLSTPKRIRGLRKDKMGIMALIHDLDELVLGDEVQRDEVVRPFLDDPRLHQIAGEITDVRNYEQRVDSAVKLLAFSAITENWPPRLQQEAIWLYTEYTFAMSDEAKAVHQCHALANLEQGLDYLDGKTVSGEKYSDIDLSTFWDDAFAMQQWLDAPIDLGPKLSQIRDEERELRVQL